MAQGFKALPPLGPYYGSDWFLNMPGEGAFDPVVNRTLAEAAEARKLPLPPNLESYAVALTRDELDENVVKKWAPFIVPDIERGEWITAMLKNCKTAKHTAIALMLYPPMEGHCPRCTHIHDPRHNAKYSGRKGRQRASKRAATSTAHSCPRMQEDTAPRSTCDASTVYTEVTGRKTESARTKMSTWPSSRTSPSLDG
jgi:hypothetical protein